MRLLALMISLLALVACGDDDDDVAVESSSTTAPAPTTETTEDDQASGGSELADVSVWIDDEALGVAEVCQGADGAVVIDTADGPRVIVVREEGLAIRISTSGGDFAESSAVEVTRVGEVQRYDTVIVADDAETDVQVEIRDDVEAALDLCPELER